MARSTADSKNPTAFNATFASANTRDVTNYIAELTAQLYRMATSNNLVLLAGLLQLATIEAKRASESSSEVFAIVRSPD